MITKLKERWGVNNNFEFVMILLAFSLAGTSISFAKKPVFHLLGIDQLDSWYLIVPLYILTLMPLYQIFLMAYGTLVGQFRFFWNFEKKMLRRFGLKLK